MDIGKAFTFISEDEGWMRKLGLGAVVNAVPFLNIAAMGYQVQISRNVADGEKRPLPEWNDLGSFFLDGLRVIGAMFVYMLPMLFLYGIAAIFMFATIDPAAMAETTSSGGPPIPPGFFAFISVIMLCGMPYTLLVWLLWPLISIQIARKNSIAACFNFRDMLQLVRQDWVNYLLVIGIYFGLSLGAGMVIMPVAFVLMFIPCLGFIAMMLLQGAVMILTQAVSGHLQGQFIQLNDAKPALEFESEPLD
ncbi:MAG: DUF4013 domain-containing protein [Chloroflexi bacterium]|nr:DUF4013 domain-containing protein [Chloroflexota bacterium]